MILRPPPAQRLSIPGPAGDIEAIAENSELGGDSYAVICHPHPLFGGTMDNKVVTTLARACAETGIPSLRFNFRGVGASKGTFDAGAGESADADAVAAWGERRWPGRRLLLAGFSFGAYVALRLAQARAAERLITIAPPVQRFAFADLHAPGCPWLIVQGEADDVVDAAAVGAWSSGLSPAPRLVLLPGVGHFFHGRLQELREIVIEEIRSG
jgi:alpha/beta superfamily hydrolase